MNTFPTLSIAPSAITLEILRKTLRSKPEEGKPMSRPLWTKSIKTFSVSFTALTETDRASLESFFDSNSGVDFYFFNPLTNVTTVSSFAEDTLVFDSTKEWVGTEALWDCKIILEET